MWLTFHVVFKWFVYMIWIPFLSKPLSFPLPFLFLFFNQLIRPFFSFFVHGEFTGADLRFLTFCFGSGLLWVDALYFSCFYASLSHLLWYRWRCCMFNHHKRLDYQRLKNEKDYAWCSINAQQGFYHNQTPFLFLLYSPFHSWIHYSWKVLVSSEFNRLRSLPHGECVAELCQLFIRPGNRCFLSFGFLFFDENKHILKLTVEIVPLLAYYCLFVLFLVNVRQKGLRTYFTLWHISWRVLRHVM